MRAYLDVIGHLARVMYYGERGLNATGLETAVRGMMTLKFRQQCRVTCDVPGKAK